MLFGGIFLFDPIHYAFYIREIIRIKVSQLLIQSSGKSSLILLTNAPCASS